MTHGSPPAPACHSPACNVLSLSLGFLLLVGWGLVEQSSLKGNQCVSKSRLSLPSGLEARGGTLARAQLPPGLEGPTGQRGPCWASEHGAHWLQTSAWKCSSVTSSSQWDLGPLHQRASLPAECEVSKYLS